MAPPLKIPVLAVRTRPWAPFKQKINFQSTSISTGSRVGVVHCTCVHPIPNLGPSFSFLNAGLGYDLLNGVCTCRAAFKIAR